MKLEFEGKVSLDIKAEDIGKLLHTFGSFNFIETLKRIERKIDIMNEQETELNNKLSSIQTAQGESEARAEARHAASQQTIEELRELIETLEANDVDLTDEIATAQAILDREEAYLAQSGGGEGEGEGETGGEGEAVTEKS